MGWVMRSQDKRYRSFYELTSTQIKDVLDEFAVPEQNAVTSLKRLARLARQTPGGASAMATVIEVMEQFLSSFDDEDFRLGVLPSLSDKATAMDNTRFRELSDASEDLHRALITIIHKSDENRSTKYLML